MRVTAAVLVILCLVIGSHAAMIERAPSGDSMIDAGNPDVNYGDAEGQCCSGKDSSALLWQWDLSDLAGWTATSDGVFNLYVYWKESELGLALYELTGGAFDEMTVTYNNYVGAGGSIDSVVGASLDTDYNEGWLELNVPQATVQAMIDGTVGGLATRNLPGEYWNHCQATRERDWQLPTLAFEATPEPVSLSMLALGGLLVLRRRR